MMSDLSDVEIAEIDYYWEQLTLGIGALKEDQTQDVRDMLPILNQCMRNAQTIRMIEESERNPLFNLDE